MRADPAFYFMQIKLSDTDWVELEEFRPGWWSYSVIRKGKFIASGVTSCSTKADVITRCLALIAANKKNPKC